ncbi:MAG TPA: D-alanine--D-alanine ligase [Syntrophobacteraceae bacterium]|nr:D-alanine--D-alanine ligase [Syntrophobacteraceae bacterium]
MEMKKLRIALLSGGKSAERAVSLQSGEQVFRALDKSRYEILRYDPATDLPLLVNEAKSIDVALIILHGRQGEDGTIQGLLDSLDIPYQGSGVLGSAIAMNKIVSKQLYVQAGLPTPPFIVAGRSNPSQVSVVVEELGLPVVVKPEHEGSSIGLTIVREQKDLQSALDKAWGFDRRCVVEKYIKGIEITAGVLGNEDLLALPVIEICPGEGYEYFDYEAKYLPGATKEICPARISEELTERSQQYARRAHKALHCKGYSRTDMILSGEDLYVLETNTIPGMTATSLFPQAAAKAGIEFPQLLDRLIELAMER